MLGIDNEKCVTRIVTINNDDNLREKVAKKWSDLNEVTIIKEMTNYTGL